ncbi:hypothetical protein GQ54DRAFT_313948 [Martensiomyces pterosporus]|nr:hypothetical protein GQ54DRAFT_313948 [Martensiomyces pterosporus]
MANFTEWMCSYTKQLVKPLVNRLTTDRMAQFVVRTILFPSVEYKLMGIPLSSQEYSDILSPMLVYVKHGFGLPSTTPSAVFHHKQGMCIPHLESRMEARNNMLTERLLNGKGSPQFAALGQELIALTAAHYTLAGNPLEFPDIPGMSGITPARGIGRSWLKYMAGVLSTRGVYIAQPPQSLSSQLLPRIHALAILRSRTPLGFLQSLARTRTHRVCDMVYRCQANPDRPLERWKVTHGSQRHRWRTNLTLMLDVMLSSPPADPWLDMAVLN